MLRIYVNRDVNKSGVPGGGIGGMSGSSDSSMRSDLI